LADIFSKSKRSEIMSKVRGTETKPEIKIRKFLFSGGFRYSKNSKLLPGSPDIVLRKYKTVVFIHGCFWHGHTCEAATLPSSNVAYWSKKIQGNVERDKRNKKELKKLGWHVITVWECQIRSLLLSPSKGNKFINSIRKHYSN
jgi:DNA mismatch endonuclease (patch repair protein)